MMVIRPVERTDVSALMQLASKTGGGLTSLPANEATLSARIERAIKTWQGELPKSEQGYVFVLEDSETGTVAGICAIEVAVGLNDPWYNYRVGTFSVTITPAAASCARCFSTRSGAKRATAICCRNRALCLWRLFATSLMTKWLLKCAG